MYIYIYIERERYISKQYTYTCVYTYICIHTLYQDMYMYISYREAPRLAAARGPAGDPKALDPVKPKTLRPQNIKP